LGAAPPLYDVTDLHALADDELDEATAARLRGVLTPADTARVTQWRRQNEIMRAAFLRVAQEPVPLPLSLLPQPQPRPTLRAVPTPAVPPRPSSRRRVGAIAGLGCGMAAAIAAVFLLSSGLDRRTAVLPTATGADVGALTTRTVAMAGEAALAPGGGELRLPNLAGVGLTLQASEAQATDAGLSACGLYKDRFGARFALCAMATPGAEDTAPTPAATRVVAWHDAGRAYSLAGPLSMSELASIATRVEAALKAP
jgi:anti-sigma factor RsiW